MYSKLGIINLALGKLGNSNLVASLVEDTEERIAATTVWDYIIDEVNEAKDWRFAKTRAFLGKGTPTTYVITELNLGKLASDPDTTGWGMAQEGANWYNTTDHHYKGWNGTEIILLG